MATEGRETLKAQIDLAPDQYAATEKFAPLYSRLNQRLLEEALMGSGGQKGLLDIYSGIQPGIDRLSAESATAQRTNDVNDIESLGPRATAAVRNADPIAARLEDLLAQQAESELGAGASLDPALERQITQSTRSAQAARGMGMGAPSVSAEALVAGRTAEALRRTRQAFAASTLAARQRNATDPFLAILGRPSGGASQTAGIAAGGQGFSAGTPSFDPFTSYASNLYGQNYSGEMDANMANAKMINDLIGSGISAAGSVGGGFAGAGKI